MHIPGKLDACRQYPVFQYKNNATLFSTTKKIEIQQMNKLL